MKTVSKGGDKCGAHTTTLELALLITDSGVHGTKSFGCGGGVLSLTSTICRSSPGSPPSLSLCTVSRSLLTVHGGLLSLL